MISGCYTVLFHPVTEQHSVRQDSDCMQCHQADTGTVNHVIWREQVELQHRTYGYAVFNDYPWWRDFDVSRVSPDSSALRYGSSRQFSRPRSRAYTGGSTAPVVAVAPSPAIHDSTETAVDTTNSRRPTPFRRRRH